MIGSAATAPRVLLLACLLAPLPAAAQQDADDTPALQAMQAVISHRLLTQEDDTRFDGCTLFGFLGGLDALVERLGPLAERAFDRTTDPCRGTEVSASRVELYSMRLGGDATAVRLRVVEGEVWHFEDYLLRPPPIVIDGAPRWVVEEVRRPR